VSEDKTPAQQAASHLFDRMSESSEDVLEELWADTWPGGYDAWIDAVTDGDEAVEPFREETFRHVLAELAALCLERSCGRYGGKPVGESGVSS
jgi:DNA-directed RNA polymerase beta subunit